MYILEDRQMYIFSKATIMTEMDELCYIRNHNTAKHTKWEATDKGIIFIEGVWETSLMVSTTLFVSLVAFVLRLSTIFVLFLIVQVSSYCSAN